MEYAGPCFFFFFLVLLSLVIAHAQAPTRRMHPTPSKATWAPMCCPALHVERVAARASMRCPPNEWLHELPYAAPRCIHLILNEWPQRSHVSPCRKDRCGPRFTATVCTTFFLIVTCLRRGGGVVKAKSNSTNLANDSL